MILCCEACQARGRVVIRGLAAVRRGGRILVLCRDHARRLAGMAESAGVAVPPRSQSDADQDQ